MGRREANVILNTVLFSDYVQCHSELPSAPYKSQMSQKRYLCTSFRFMGSDGDEKEDIEATMVYYGTTFIEEADFPFNFNLINVKNLSGNSIFEAVNLWMRNMPAGKWPNWAVRILDLLL